jgi:hypothetical protein
VTQTPLAWGTGKAQLRANGDRIDGLPEDIIDPLQRGKTDRQQYMLAPDQEVPTGFELPRMFPIRVILPISDSVEEEERKQKVCAATTGSSNDGSTLSSSSNISETFASSDGLNSCNPMFDLEEKMVVIEESKTHKRNESWLQSSVIACSQNNMISEMISAAIKRCDRACLENMQKGKLFQSVATTSDNDKTTSTNQESSSLTSSPSLEQLRDPNLWRFKVVGKYFLI